MELASRIGKNINFFKLKESGLNMTTDERDLKSNGIQAEIKTF